MHSCNYWILPCAIIYAQINKNFADDLEKTKPKPTPFQDFDYLVYSQRWPITACTVWEEHAKDNQCGMPPDLTEWTVHGIWPSKIGEEGPFFCDSSIHFDPGQLEPLMNDLTTRWTNIEASTKPDSFWKHEWDKHGTCADVLPELNSVYNFFKKGLELNIEYSLTAILAKSNIVPNAKGYTVEDLHNSIKSATNKNPSIECITDREGQSLINEIRICLDKDLEVIDCDVTNTTGLSNCSLKKPVMYYATLPNNTASDEAYEQMCLENVQQEENLFNWYLLFKFITWFTF